MSFIQCHNVHSFFQFGRPLGGYSLQLYIAISNPIFPLFLSECDTLITHPIDLYWICLKSTCFWVDFQMDFLHNHCSWTIECWETWDRYLAWLLSIFAFLSLVLFIHYHCVIAVFIEIWSRFHLIDWCPWLAIGFVQMHAIFRDWRAVDKRGIVRADKPTRQQNWSW